MASVMAVELALAKHYRRPRCEPSQDILIYWSKITARHKTTGRAVCVCTPLPGEQMTAFQLSNCVVTLLAEVLPAPRISIRLFWVPRGQTQFDVEFSLGLLTTFIDSVSLYDEMYDPDSLYWEDHGPLHKPGMIGCLYCGDSTQNVDDTDVDRSELCSRCCPCAV